MKATVDPAVLKRAMNLARIVKPVTGDFTISFTSGGLSIWSFDRRRSVISRIKFISGVIDSNDEYFLPNDRASLFDSELSNLSLSVNDKGITLKFDGENKTRSATIKKRAENSKRQKSPTAPDFSEFKKVSSLSLDYLLKQVSCSALVRETKTDEDMKINQIHFYSDDNYVTSNARFYATYVHMNDIGLDFSIVSSDIPLIRSFCSKSGEDVLVGSDSRSVYFVDPTTESWISLLKVSSERPKLVVPVKQHKSSVQLTKEDFHKSVKWCLMAIEGTQRVTMNFNEQSLRMLSNNNELSSIPIKLDGPEFSTDLSIKILSTISDHLDDGEFTVLYGNSTIPDVIEFTQSKLDIDSRHFVKGMKTK